MNNKLDGRSCYTKPKGGIKKLFTISHYAGKVQYDCDTFVEKNKDSVSDQIKAVMAESKHDIISKTYKPLLEASKTP